MIDLITILLGIPLVFLAIYLGQIAWLFVIGTIMALLRNDNE